MAIATSMIGFAASPCTEVLPMCSMRMVVRQNDRQPLTRFHEDGPPVRLCRQDPDDVIWQTDVLAHAAAILVIRTSMHMVIRRQSPP